MILARSLAMVALLGSCGGGAAEGPSMDRPAALAEYGDGYDVTPFTGWSVPGVRLYTVVLVGVADLSRAHVVGVDGSGALVRGPALMDRMGELPPEELAARVMSVLIGKHGSRALTPGERLSELGTDAQWARVRAPAIVDGALVFYALVGDMSPELVEHRVQLEEWTVSTRSVTDVLLAEGETVAIGSASCQPFTVCGCWSGCARMEPVRRPGIEEPTFRVVGGEHAGVLGTRHGSCAGGAARPTTCARACRSDTAEAPCDDAIELEVACGEACPPSEAPYHCVTYEDRCERVDHVVRTRPTSP